MFHLRDQLFAFSTIYKVQKLLTCMKGYILVVESAIAMYPHPALTLQKMGTAIIYISSLILEHSILCNDSHGRSFYIYLMNMHVNGHNDLISQIMKTCDHNA